MKKYEWKFNFILNMDKYDYIERGFIPIEVTGIPSEGEIASDIDIMSIMINQKMQKLCTTIGSRIDAGDEHEFDEPVYIEYYYNRYWFWSEETVIERRKWINVRIFQHKLPNSSFVVEHYINDIKIGAAVNKKPTLFTNVKIYADCFKSKPFICKINNVLL